MGCFRSMLDPIQFFKCLADETRLNLVTLIFREGELCVCELMEALGQSQPKISRHLAQLRGAGVLADARRGQWVYYSLHPELPPWALGILEQASEANGNALQGYRSALDGMANRPGCCS